MPEGAGSPGGWLPVHVRLSAVPEVGDLGAPQPLAAVHAALASIAIRPGFRVVHSAVDGREVHVIAEADGAPGLASGLRVLQIRLTLALREVTGRTGAVLRERTAQVLHSAAEVKAALERVAGGCPAAEPASRLLRKFPSPPTCAPGGRAASRPRR
jgi:hypothetical protein